MIGSAATPNVSTRTASDATSARTVPRPDDERHALGLRVDGRLGGVPGRRRLDAPRLGPLLEVVVHLVDLGLDGVDLGRDRLKSGAAKVLLERADEGILVVLLRNVEAAMSVPHTLQQRLVGAKSAADESTRRRASEWQLTTRKPSCLICALRQAIGLVFPDKNVLVTVS